MDSLQCTRFTVTTTHGKQHKLQHCSFPERYLYMANTINNSGVEMPRKMNAQAVINKIRILQKEHGADEEGFKKWKLEASFQASSSSSKAPCAA
jgi:hypothetical protein